MFGIPEAVRAVSNLATTIIDKKFPNATEVEKVKLAALAAEMQNEFNLALGQIEINKIEASNPSVFVSGWRPAVGWVCVIGLLYSFLLQPILAWASTIVGVNAPPILESGVIIGLVTTLLGTGVMRSYDKAQGVDTKGVSLK
ncbi:MAG: hypothetical protein E6Q97_27050 [Desulfurellales bacterium]|nr:MAG: hypothetical protein E6Q97_27050 [Desulfurellales bacterium]